MILHDQTKWSNRPLGWLISGWRHRLLIGRLAKRELQAQYRGSVLGVAWTVVLPLLMLSVYTFVFSHVLSSRWGQATGTGSFALRLFCGLIAFQIIAKSLSQGPSLIQQHTQYVKNIVFPIQILPYTVLLPALVEAAISFTLLGIFQVVSEGLPPLTVLLIPILCIPLCMLSLGSMWLLSSLGVFFKDIHQITGVVITALMFMSAIFYPIEIIPQQYRFIIHANPLAILIDQMRTAMFGTGELRLTWILGCFAGSLLVAEFGYYWFRKTQEGFADVL